MIRKYYYKGEELIEKLKPGSIIVDDEMITVIGERDVEAVCLLPEEIRMLGKEGFKDNKLSQEIIKCLSKARGHP